MAIDLTSKDIVAFGDRANRKQMIFLLPAEANADKPGILVFGNVDGSGTVGNGACMWADNTGAIRYDTTIPTDEDSDGTAISASAGANVTLSNLSGTVAIPITIASDTANTDDLGTEPKPWRTGYLGTSLVFVGTTYNSTLAFTEGAASRTYTIPDAGAAAKVMLDTGATNGITYTNGTASIALAAGNTDISLGAAANITVGASGDVDFGTGAVAFNGTAAFDQATGTVVDINANLTVSGAATVDQDLSASGAPTWTSLVTCQGLTNTATAINSTAAINIGADNVKFTLGASGATDGAFWFDGSGNVMCYDTNLGTARSLSDMYSGTPLNPTVVGNLTISDGNFTWTNATDTETAVWTLAATTVDGIQINSSCTTADVIQITADGMANGTAILVDCDGGVGATGYYFRGYDGSANDITIGEDGEINIKGAATDIITVDLGNVLVTAGNITATLGNIVATAGNVAVTLGDVALTDGDITNAEGKLTVSSTADEISYIKRNNATGTGPVFEIEETNAAGGVTLLVDSDHTGASDAQQITYDGTASGLNVTNTAVTGTQVTLAGPAAQTTAVLYYTGDFDGATDVGVIDITSTGTHVHANTSLVYLDHNTGAPAASARGSLLRLNDTTANAADAWVAYIGTTNNDGLLITTGAVADINLKLTGIQAQDAQMVHVDGSTGTGWVGASTVGCVDIESDGVLAAGANLLRVDSSGANTAASFAVEILQSGALAGATSGSALRIVESGAAAATSYAVYISSTSNEALHIDAGEVLIDEKLTASGGIVTKVDITDIATGSTPTDLEAIAAFGAAATTGAGFIGIVDDAGGHATEALVWSDGTKYWYVTGTACA